MKTRDCRDAVDTQGLLKAEGLHNEDQDARQSTRAKVLHFQSCLNWVLGVTVIFLLIRDLRAIDTHDDPTRALYSPANEAVEYVHTRFNRSRGADKSLFQGWPTDEIDAHWQAHYLAGMLSTVDAESALQLPDETSRFAWPGRENEYLVTLDIFHQLHCLDVVRKALYRDRYDKHFYRPDGSVDYCKWLHVDHCLDQVRQALMCQADTSVVPFEWSEVVEGMRPRVDNAHVCRNYTKILAWAHERGVPAEQWHSSRRVIELRNGTFKIETGRNHAELGSESGECNAI